MNKTSLFILFSLLLLILIINLKHLFLKSKIKKYSNNNYKKIYFIKIFLLILISIFISLTFSNYKGGLKKISNYSMTIDNVIIIDYSTSMLANDVKPTRFDTAKNLAIYLIENSINCRFALILFGNDALLEVPLTENMTYLKNVISSIQLNDEYYRSSNISNALVTALNLLDSSPAFYKNIILLSDFDFDQLISTKLKNIISDRITFFYNIVVASEEGSKIWLPNKKTFLLDNFQNEVLSTYNISFISDLSKLQNVLFLYFKDQFYNTILSVISNNKNLKSKMEQHDTFVKKELNYIFGTISFLLMIIYLIYSSNILENIKEILKTRNKIKI